MRKPMENPLFGDLSRAQQRIRVLADLAALHLPVEKLNALNVTISAYFTRIAPEISLQIDAELEGERKLMRGER